MKIVVLDGYTLNPGDLNWDALHELGDVTIYDHTPPDKCLVRASGAEIIFTNKTPLPGAVIQLLPALRFIGVLATGYDVVDVKAAAARNIPVCNVAAYGSDSVAQMAFAHLLNLTNRVGVHAASVASGDWSKCRDFCYWLAPVTELKDKVFGVVGFGRIGHEAARLAEAFKMKVLIYDMINTGDSRQVDLAVLLKQSDVISLHCPLTPETRNIINADAIQLMKKSAFLINTSRGQLIDNQALADALRRGDIAGAGIDVLEQEPPPLNHPLPEAVNCFVTPHISWASREARQRLMDIAVGNLRAFLAGTSVNVVNQ